MVKIKEQKLSANKIKNLFKEFEKKRVLIIGDAMLDAYWWGSVDRISPEAPVPIVLVKEQEYRLGGAANVALNIKALGAEPLLCAVIGKDEAGRTFKKVMQQNNISSEFLLVSNKRATTIKTRVIGNKHQLLRVDQEVENEITLSDRKKLKDKIINLLNNNKPDVIIFEDYDKGLLSPEIIKETIKAAGEKKIPVVVDPKKKNFLHYKNATLFKPNLRELKEGLKIDFDHRNNMDELREAVNILKEKITPEMVMVTLSENGVYIKNGGEHHLIPAHVRNVYDVSGAGDTVISVAALALASGLSPYYIAGISNLAGGIVCEYVGVVPVNKEIFLQECIKYYAA